MSFRALLILSCSFFLSILGCVDILPTNPYDPAAPLSAQFKGTIKGRLIIQGLEEEDMDSFKISLYSQRRPVKDDFGEDITYNTRTRSDVQALDSDADIGSFEILVEAGTYKLYFDPELNGQEESLAPAFSLEEVSVLPGEEYEVSIFVEPLVNLDELECFQDINCDFGYTCNDQTKKCIPNADADRDGDSIPDVSDLCPDVISVNGNDIDQDGLGDECDPDRDGDFILNEVDNCPDHNNPSQANANQQDELLNNTFLGNACEGHDGVRGTSIIGQLIVDPSDAGRLSEAQVSIELNQQASNLSAAIDQNGLFEFFEVLTDQGLFKVTIDLTGYEIFQIENTASLFVTEWNLGEMSLVRKVGSLYGTAQRLNNIEQGGVKVQVVGTDLVTYSDQQGQWRFDDIPTGTYSILFESEHFVEQLKTEVTVVAGQDVEVESIALEPDLMASIEGQVQSSIDIFDLTTVFISLYQLDGSAEYVFSPLADGHFAKDELPVGLYQLLISAPGHSTYQDTLQVNANTHVDAIELSVQQGEHLLIGRVDLDGADLDGGVQVRAFIGQQQQSSDQSNDDGSFTLQVTALDYTLTFSKSGYEPLSVDVQWSDVRQQFETIVETDTGNESRRVSEVQLIMNRRLESSLSAYLTTELREYDWSQALVTVSEVNGSITQQGIVLANGQFTIEDLATGLYILNINAPGHIPIERLLSIDSGVNQLETIDLALAIEDDNIQGRVFLEGASSHEGITVRARINGSLIDTSFTDDAGHYVLTLPPVDFTLQFSKEGFDTLAIDLLYQSTGPQMGQATLNDTPLHEINNLILDRLTGQVSVQVSVLPEWIPANQKQVNISVIGEGQERSITAFGSSVVFTDLPAGNYLVFAERSGFIQARQSFNIDREVSDPTVSLTLEMNSLGDARLDLSGVQLSGDDLAAIEDLRNSDLNGSDLSGADLCNLNLSGSSFVGADLQGVNFSGSDLRGARLDNATLNQALIHGADLTNASLFGANLSGAKFYKSSYQCHEESFESEKTNLTAAVLSSALMEDSEFTSENEDLSAVNCENLSQTAPILSNAYWNQTNLNRANLSGVNLQDSILSSTILSNAQLEYACLRRASLVRVDLGGSSLTKSDLSQMTALDTLFNDVSGTQTKFNEASLSGANLTNASLPLIEGYKVSFAGVIFQNTDLSGGTLKESSWVGSLLNGVNLSGADLSGFNDDHQQITYYTDLRNIQVIDSIFSNTTLTYTNLQNSSFSGVQLRGVNLEGSKLTGADFSRTNLEGSNLDNCILLDTDLRLARYDSLTEWPDSFDSTTITALGPNTQLGGYIFPIGFDVRGVDLTGADLSGTRLVDMNFENATLVGANFDEANLSGAYLAGADLSGASLISTQWTRSNLSDAQLGDVNLEKSNTYNLSGACPSILPEDWGCIPLDSDKIAILGPYADLRGADLSNSDLSNMDLSFAITHGMTGDCPSLLPSEWSCRSNQNGELFFFHNTADLIEADLSGADLSNLDLQGVDFSQVNISGADLSGTKTVGIVGVCNTLTLSEDTLCYDHLSVERKMLLIEEGVDLSGVHFSHYAHSLHDVRFKGVLLDGTIFDMPEQSTNLDFREADLSTAQFPIKENIIQATFYDLIGGCPSGIDPSWQCMPHPVTNSFVIFASNSNYQHADLSQFVFNNLDLSLSNFSNADLSGSIFTRSYLIGTHFSNADLSGSRFIQFYLDDAHFNDADLMNTEWDRSFREKTTYTDKTDFTDADLSNSTWSGLLTNALLHNTNLTGVDFPPDFEFKQVVTSHLIDCPAVLPDDVHCLNSPEGLILVGPNLDLSNMNLSNVDLSGINLSEVILGGSNLSEANLTNAKTNNIWDCPAQLPEQWSCVNQPSGSSVGSSVRAILFGPEVDLSEISGNNMVVSLSADLYLNSSNLSNSNLILDAFNSSIDFSGADLNGLRISADTLDTVDFSGADLRDLNWCVNDTSEIIFSEATLCPSNVLYSELTPCSLTCSSMGDQDGRDPIEPGGNTGESGSGNTDESGSGNTDEFGSGNTDESGSGNTDESGSGNTDESGSGNTGDDGESGSGDDGDLGSGDTGRPGSGNTGESGSGNTGESGSGDDGDLGSGDTGRPG
jgi:uncharacterized protein YjbI with pentapeptide repeats